MKHSEEQVERAIHVAGAFASGSADGSSDHDRYFADAITFGDSQERNGGDDGVRTRDLRRDRPAF
jgi:hypothetical protein